MRSHPIFVALGILISAMSLLVGATVWQQLHMLYPTPETESAFLRNYTPKKVIERFEEAGEGSSYGNHKSGGAGTKYVTHSGGFEWHFTIRSEKWMALMDGLEDDVHAQLLGSGAQILNQIGDARDGFHFEYKLGKSFGAVTISPLRVNSGIHRATPHCPGLVDVDARIEQTETWFPKPPGLMMVRINDKH